MNSLGFDQVYQYVHDNLDHFHTARLESLRNLDMRRLTQKNPYLYCARNVWSANDIIKDMMGACLAGNEEEILGRFLGELAIFVCAQTMGGHKSTTAGLDLEFVGVDGVYYIVAIKSGPNWGNSSQKARLVNSFRLATRRLHEWQPGRLVQPTLGICYGKTRTSRMKQGYLKVAGQNFWSLISGSRTLYTEIVGLVGYQATQKSDANNAYAQERVHLENKLTAEFLSQYCLASGAIDWEKLVEASSPNYDLDKVLDLQMP